MPDLLTLVVLVLAAYRLTRLAGWDEFPLAAKIRARVTGETWTRTVHSSGMLNTVRVTADDPPYVPQFHEAAEISLPGKTPETNVEEVRVAYSRPTLAHLIHCPFCIGFWVSTAVYLVWLAAGAPGEQIHSWLFYPLMPFAISGMVGIVSKNLDA